MFLDFTWIAFSSRDRYFLWVSSTQKLEIIQFSQVLPLHRCPGCQDPCWQAVRIALISLLSQDESKHSLEATNKIRVLATYWTKISVFSTISITFWNAVVLTIVSPPTLLGGLFSLGAQFLRVKQKEGFPGVSQSIKDEQEDQALPKRLTPSPAPFGRPRPQWLLSNC